MNKDLMLPDAKSIFKEILSNPEKMFDLLRIDMVKCCERAISELFKLELTEFLGREKYERVCPAASKDSVLEEKPATFEPDVVKNYRNGS